MGLHFHVAGFGHNFEGLVVGGWPSANLSPVDGTKHGFKRGIETINMNSASAENVFVQGCVVDSAGAYPLNVLQTEYGWYCHADVGKSSDNNRWTNCDFSWALAGFKGRGHLEGLFFTNTNPGFVGYGFDIQCSDTTNPPCFIWTACQTECFYDSILIDNAAYVIIQGNNFYQDTNLAGTYYAIRASDVIRIHSSNNDIVPIAGGANVAVVGYLKATDCTSVRSEGNTADGLSGSMVWFDGTTQNSITDSEICLNPVGAVPFQNSANLATDAHYATALTNKRRRWTIVNASDAQGKQEKSGTFSATVFTGNVGGAQAAFFQLTFGVMLGDQVEIRVAAQYFENAGESYPLSVIREYNHRPATVSPYQILQFADTRNNALDRKVLNANCGEAYWHDTMVCDIIATASDALISFESSAAPNGCKLDEVQMRIVRR
jgi:hypothetical protein